MRPKSRPPGRSHPRNDTFSHGVARSRTSATCHPSVMRTISHYPLVAAALAAFALATCTARGVARADARQDRYRVAAGHYQQGRWQLAADEFRKLLAEGAPGQTVQRAHFYLGESLVQLRQFDDAAVQFHQFLQANSDAALARKALFRAGEASHLGGHLDAAQRDLQAFLKQYPDDGLCAYALSYLAEIARSRSRPADAETLFRQSLDKYPAGPLADDCRYGLARALEAQRNDDEAKRLYAALAAGSSAWADDAQYALAVRQYADGALAEALKAFEAFETTFKDSNLRDVARLGLVRTLAQMAVASAREKQFDQAHERLEQLAARQAPHDLLLSTTAQLADAALAAGRLDRAQTWYARLAADDNPSPQRQQGLLGLAWSQTQAGKLDEASETFERFLNQFPDHPSAAEAALARGQLLQKLKRNDAALAMYRSVIERHAQPEQLRSALLAAARLHARLEQNVEAAALYKRLADEFPKSTDADAVLYEWAWVERSRGDSTAAFALWSRLHDEQRTSRLWPDATCRVAQHALDEKQYDQAEKLAAELLAADNAGDIVPHALYLQGQIAVRRERWSEVAAPLEKLLAKYAGHALALPASYWVAEADYRQQKYAEAGQRLVELEEKTRGRTEPWVAMIPLRRAQVLAQQSRWNEALALAVEIEKRRPDFAQQYEVDYLIGRCLAADAKFEEARQSYEKVVRSKTGGKSETAAMAQWMIGESYMHQKEYAVALREYLKVEILYAYPTWQAAALLQAAKCHEFLDQWPEADRLYRRLLEAYPTTSFTDEATRRLQHVRRQAAAPTRS
jgi:TolA-binding protein